MFSHNYLQMKFDRKKRLKRIMEMESSMCTSLGEVSQLKAVYKSDTVPSEEDLKTYRNRVEDLEFTLVSNGGGGP